MPWHDLQTSAWANDEWLVTLHAFQLLSVVSQKLVASIKLFSSSQGIWTLRKTIKRELKTEKLLFQLGRDFLCLPLFRIPFGRGHSSSSSNGSKRDSPLWSNSSSSRLSVHLTTFPAPSPKKKISDSSTQRYQPTAPCRLVTSICISQTLEFKCAPAIHPRAFIFM